MPRRRRDKKKIDQGDWNACIAWRRMFVAVSSSGSDLSIPIAVFLTDCLKPVADSNGRADASMVVLRDAWKHLRDGHEWSAIVVGIQARCLALGKARSEDHEEEGIEMCQAFREAYPVSPPGFERVGRLADGRHDD